MTVGTVKRVNKEYLKTKQCNQVSIIKKNALYTNHFSSHRRFKLRNFRLQVFTQPRDTQTELQPCLHRYYTLKCYQRYDKKRTIIESVVFSQVSTDIWKVLMPK